MWSLPGIGSKRRRSGTRGAHQRSLQVRQQGIPQEKTIIRAGKAEIGGDQFITMAGPCSVESEKQIMETAEAVAAAGATILRGGRFQTAHFALRFSGHGSDGLKLLAKARKATGAGDHTEVMSDSDVGLVAEYADIMQIARATCRTSRC